MDLKRLAVTNVASNWLALGLSIAVGFFLAPFIIHHLGDDSYGLWILVYSVTGSYGLFDLGIRSSVVRYVSKFAATGDRAGLSRIVSTSLFTYCCIGLVSLAVTTLGYFYINKIFRISPEFRTTAADLFLMVGLATSLDFPLGVAGGILEGLQQIYLLNLTRIGATVCRAILIVIFLRHGYGLLMVAFITVSLPIISSIVRTSLAYRLLQIPLGLSYVDRATVRSIARYSSVMLLIMVAGRLRFQTDAMIIGVFMSVAAITLFTIGSRMVSYATEITQSLAEIFTPMVSHFEAMQNLPAIRKIFILGNRACALVMFPLTVGLIVLGKCAIRLWVGEKYVASAFPVLVILLVPSALWAAQATSTKVLFGMSKHKALAVATIVEGVANVGLSVLLVRHWGINGDALGTAIPLTCNALFFLPFYLCHLLDVSVKKFVWNAYALPLASSMLLLLALASLQRWLPAYTLWQFVRQIVCGGIVYGASVVWLSERYAAYGFSLRARLVQLLRQQSLVRR